MICDTPFYVMPKAGTEKVPVPCGRCPNCKIRRVNSWVFRLQEQDKVSYSSHFVTLTYDTDHVPISENGFMTLRKKDFQDYMKRLRKIVKSGFGEDRGKEIEPVKYFAVGEYGSTNSRPHYHAIIFNVPDTEMFFRAWSLAGVAVGTVHVGRVTSDSIAYTLKYIDKLRPFRRHSRDDRVLEFSVMSKHLGASYLTDQIVNYHKADLSRLFISKLDGYKIALPRYYRQKIYTDYEQQQQLRIIQAQVQLNADLDFSDYIRDFVAPDGTLRIDYQRFKNSEKFQRFKKFYSQQKERKL